MVLGNVRFSTRNVNWANPTIPAAHINPKVNVRTIQGGGSKVAASPSTCSD
jgi:hypothetical protein